MKNLLNISLKMIIVGLVSLFLAYLLGVRNYTTASAIGILSVQWSKRDFFKIAAKRLSSGILSIAISGLLFYFLGQNFLNFSIFIVVFILLSWFLNAPEGIVPSLVIVAHIFLIDKITVGFIFEEILLLLIAVLVAFVVNMTYPQYTKNQMTYNLHKVDAIVEDFIIYLIRNMKGDSSLYSNNVTNDISRIMNEAKMIDRDIILQNDHRYITYLYMRDTQLSILKNISKNVNKIDDDHPYKDKIIIFLTKVSKNIGFKDRASSLLIDLEELDSYFINAELPKTRKEFELRAILFQIFNEVRAFLELKVEFHNKYPHFMEEKVN